MTRMRIGPVRPAKRCAGGAHGAMSRAHRVADHPGVHVAAEAVGKGLEHLARQVRQTAVGEAGDGVLLVDDQRTARQPGGDAAGPGDEAPEPHHHARLVTPHDRQRLQQRAAAGERARRARSSAPLPRRPPIESHSIGMPSAGTMRASSPRSVPSQMTSRRLFAQQARQRERREHVSAGAAGHDEDGPAHAAPRTVAEPRCSRMAS